MSMLGPRPHPEGYVDDYCIPNEQYVRWLEQALTEARGLLERVVEDCDHQGLTEEDGCDCQAAREFLQATA